MKAMTKDQISEFNEPMRELDANEIREASGGVTASELSGNLYVGAGILGIAAAATMWAPPVSIGLAMGAGAFGALGATAGLAANVPKNYTFATGYIDTGSMCMAD